MEAEQISAWISEQRFAPFLERAGGNRTLAAQIYLWHAQVAGAGLATLHHFEVALRNAIDRQLGAGQPNDPVDGTWLLDPGTLSAQGIAKVRDVLLRLRREILEPLTNLHLWRNRIAHHDSLLDQNLERRLSEMVGVANAIDPACGGWLATHTQMTVLLRQRPDAPQ